MRETLSRDGHQLRTLQLVQLVLYADHTSS